MMQDLKVIGVLVRALEEQAFDGEPYDDGDVNNLVERVTRIEPLLQLVIEQRAEAAELLRQIENGTDDSMWPRVRKLLQAMPRVRKLLEAIDELDAGRLGRGSAQG